MSTGLSDHEAPRIGHNGGPPLDRLTYTVDETAKLLGIGRNQCYAAAGSGAIAGVKVIRVGNRMLIPKAALDRVLAGEAA
jgi:excisionase family DNA binding protein